MRFPGRALALLTIALIAAAGRAEDTSATASLYGDALVRSWCRPSYPPDLVREQRQGIVVVRFVVDDLGSVVRARVLRAFDARAAEPALQAVKLWKFQPGVAAGKPVASCLDVRVYFLLRNLKEKRPPLAPAPAETPRGAPRTEPDGLDRPDPEYPPELAARFAGARISVEMEIDARGRVTMARVLRAPDPALVPGALAAVRQWTFSPARQGDLAVPAVHRSIILLDSGTASPALLPPQELMDLPETKPGAAQPGP